MTREASKSNLLAWSLSPPDHGRLLAISPTNANEDETSKAGFFAQRVGLIQFAISSLFKRVTKLFPSDPGVEKQALCSGADSTKHDDGCKVCKDAYFEIGSTSAGQEYL